MLKIKLFTHTDLDGIGALAVLKHYFNRDAATITPRTCSYDQINTEVTKFLKYDYAEYDLIFITDISVDADTAALVEEKYQAHKNIQLIDHHETALWLNDYDWAHVIVGEADRLESGTSLLNTYLSDTFAGSGLTSTIQADAIAEFAETVRLYDTWEWHARGDVVPQQLNDLLGQYGREQFVHRFANDPAIAFNGLETALVKKVAAERDAYIARKLDHQTFTTVIELGKFVKHTLDMGAFGEKELAALKVLFDPDAGYDTATLVLTAVERYHSEVGNAIATQAGDDSIVILFDFHRKTMSFRTAGRFPVNQLAVLFGGGGHAKSAGAPINANLLKAYWSRIL